MTFDLAHRLVIILPCRDRCVRAPSLAKNEFADSRTKQVSGMQQEHAWRLLLIDWLQSWYYDCVCYCCFSSNCVKIHKNMVVAGDSVVKNLPGMLETRVQSLGWEDPLEKGMATHYWILAWRISWTQEPCQLQSMGLQKNWTQLSD